MFENVLGRLINGAVWGLGAAVVLAIGRGGSSGVRPVGKAMMKGYVAVADRISEVTAEARENLEDLYHEAKSERGERTEPPANGRSPSPRRPTRSKA